MNKSIELIDAEAFGKKVKAWSEGAENVPATVGALMKSVPGALAITGYTDDEPVIVSRLPPMTDGFSLALPHPADLNVVIDPDDYRLPPFYKRLAFGVDPTLLDDADPAAKAAKLARFRTCRLADYSVVKCS